MPLHTLQLSYRPKKRRIPQVLKVVSWALLAWGLTLGLVWEIGRLA